MDTFQWRMKWRRFAVQFKKKEYRDQLLGPWKRPARDVLIFVVAMLFLFLLIRRDKSGDATSGGPAALERDPVPSSPPVAKSADPAAPVDPASALEPCDDPSAYGAVEEEQNGQTFYTCPANLPAEPVCMRFHRLNSKFPKVTHAVTCPNPCVCCSAQYFVATSNAKDQVEFLGYTDGPCPDDAKTEPLEQVETPEDREGPPPEVQEPSPPEAPRPDYPRPERRGPERRRPRTDWPEPPEGR